MPLESYIILTMLGRDCCIDFIGANLPMKIGLFKVGPSISLNIDVTSALVLPWLRADKTHGDYGERERWMQLAQGYG